MASLPLGSPGPTPSARGASLRWLAALTLVPLLLFGPIVAAGRVFLPYLPVFHEPLASEHPADAVEAGRDGNWTMGDRVFPFLTDQVAARAEIRGGAWPTWEPLLGLGMPLLAGTIAGLAYPPNWLAFLIAPERATAPLAGLSLFLAGLGAWLFLRRIAVDRRAALVGVLAYQLGGWGLANLYYYMKVDAALWCPWALWAVEGLAQRKRGSAAALVFALTLSFLAGMASIAVFVVAVAGLYALVRLGPWRAAAAGERRGLGPLAAAALLCALGAAGSAVWAWPVAEAGAASRREALTVASASAIALPPESALGVLVPDLLGPPTDVTPPGCFPIAWWLSSSSERAQGANVLEWNTYALVAVALLALVGVVANPRRAAFPALLLVGVFAFAQAWPLVRYAIALPGFGLGAPARVLGLAWFLWPWLAALGVEALLARAPRALPTLLTAAFAAAVASFLAWRELEPTKWAADLHALLLERYAGKTTPEEVQSLLPLELATEAARHLAGSLARAFAATLAVLVAGALALVSDRHRPRFEEGPRPWALALGVGLALGCAALPLVLIEGTSGSGSGALGPQALLALSGVCALAALAAPDARGDHALWFPLAAVLLFEGFLGSHGHVRGRELPGVGLFPPSPSLEAVREAAGDGRILRVDGTPDLAAVVRLARPNMLVPYGMPELASYTTFTPEGLAELAEGLDPGMLWRTNLTRLPDLAHLEAPLLDLLRVACVLSLEPLSHPRLVPVLERPGFCVYRRLGALPLARIVPEARVGASDAAVVAELAGADPELARLTRIAPEDGARLTPFAPGADWSAGALTVERPAKDRVRVRVTGSRGGWLVLHEQWAEGWHARIDGTSVQLLRADHVYRAVALPAKEGELVVDFHYAPRSLEWGASITLIVLLGVLVWELLNRER